jgi:hypothetical protein
MPSAVINLSSDYSLDDAEPILRAAGRGLVFFDEFADIRLPEIVEEPECITTQIQRLYHFYMQYCSTLDAEDANLRVQIILGYDKWEFMSYGELLNRHTAFKVDFLLEQFRQVFHKQFQHLHFVFYIAAIHDKPYADFYRAIEYNGLMDHDNTSYAWFNHKSFNVNCLKRKARYEETEINDKLTDIPAFKQIIEDIQNEIHRVVHKILQPFDAQTLAGRLAENIDTEIKKLQTIRDFQSIDFEDLCRKEIDRLFSFKKFSHQKQYFLKIPLTISTLAEAVNSKYRLAALLQTISQVSEEKMREIFKNEGCVFTATEVAFGKPNMEQYLKSINGLISAARTKKLPEDSELVFREYQLNPALAVNLRPNLDLRSYNYLSLKKRIPWFYTYNKVFGLIASVDPGRIREMENQTLDQKELLFSRLSMVSLQSEERRDKIAGIRRMIKEMETHPIRVESTIDFDDYIARRDELAAQMIALKDILKSKLLNLCKLSRFILLSSILFLVIHLFYWPVFLQTNSTNFVFFLPAMALSFLTAFIIASIRVRNQASAILRQIQSINDQMVDNLRRFTLSIREAAITLAQAFVYKCNLDALNQAAKGFNDQNLKTDRWLAFLQKMVRAMTHVTRTLKLSTGETPASFSDDLLSSCYYIPESVLQGIQRSELKLKADDAAHTLTTTGFITEIKFIQKVEAL